MPTLGELVALGNSVDESRRYAQDYPLRLAERKYKDTLLGLRQQELNQEKELAPLKLEYQRNLLEHEQNKLAQDKAKGSGNVQGYAALAASIASGIPDPAKRAQTFTQALDGFSRLLPDYNERVQLMNLKGQANNPDFLRALVRMQDPEKSIQQLKYDRMSAPGYFDNLEIQSQIDTETAHKRKLEIEELKAAGGIREAEIRSKSGVGGKVTPSAYSPSQSEIDHYAAVLNRLRPDIDDEVVEYDFAQSVVTKIKQGVPEQKAIRDAIAELSQSMQTVEQESLLPSWMGGGTYNEEQYIPGSEGQTKRMMTVEGRQVEYLGVDEQGRHRVRDPETGRVGTITQ